MGEKDGWNEWSKHVILELERLNKNYESLKDSIESLHIISSSIEEIKDWKSDVSEVWSPSQMKNAIKEIEENKTFKTQVKTSFLIANIVWGLVITAFTVFKK
jgi:hypothetical protein